MENQNVKTGNLSTILLIIGFRNFRELYQNLTKDQRNKLSKFYGSESLVIMAPYEFKVASILFIFLSFKNDCISESFHANKLWLLLKVPPTFLKSDQFDR